MTRIVNTAIGLATLAILGSPLRADDSTLLKGSTGAESVKTLKGASADDTSIVPVFHGRLLACLCHKWAYCFVPPPVCCDVPSVGGGYAAPPPTAGGFGYAAPAYRTAPAYAYSAPNPAYFAPVPSQAVVTLPRLGLSFTIGGGGLYASRSTLGNRFAPRSFEDVAPELPPAEARPDQFRYDGGPSNLIPMPGVRSQPLPEIEPNPAPAKTNRAKAIAAAPTWVAYGERPMSKPAPVPGATLVKKGSR